MSEGLLLRDLAVVMVAAATITIICHWLRQPAVLGYLLAGLLIGPHTPPFTFVRDIHSIQTMAELGLVFLMFTLGLQFSLPRLRRIGPSAIIASCFEIAAMFGAGFALGRAFGWDATNCVYLGAVLSISSTTIVVKVLMDLKLLQEPFAALGSGILVFEDIAAIVALTALSGLTGGGLEGTGIAFAVLRVGFFVVFFIVCGLTFIPPLIDRVGRLRSTELLGIVVLGLCLASALVARATGFNLALGAFLMGAIVGVSREIDIIESWIHPIRDMFSALFFVSAGMLIEPQMLSSRWGLVLLTTFVLWAGKTIAVGSGAFLSGHGFRTSIRTGLSLAQIGEFSFVIALMAGQSGRGNPLLYPLTVSVSALATLCLPTLVRYGDPIAESLERAAGARGRHWLERYPQWLKNWKAEQGAQTSIYSKYLVRLAVYASLLTALYLAMRVIAAWLVPPGGWPEAAFWTAVAFAATPLMRSIAYYANHFLLLALMQLLLRWRAGRLLQRIPIQRSFDLMGLIIVGALILGFFDRGPGGVLEPLWRWGLATVCVCAYVLLRHRCAVAAASIEKGLDQILGLATSEPVRRAAMSVPESGNVLEDSMERILLNADSPALHQTLRAIALREKTGASVVALYRRGKLLANPSPTTSLLPNDIVVVLGERKERAAARRLLS